MVRKARKKPIEVQAMHYNHNIILDEFLKLLRSNESESVVLTDDACGMALKKHGRLYLRNTSSMPFSL